MTSPTSATRRQSGRHARQVAGPTLVTELFTHLSCLCQHLFVSGLPRWVLAMLAAEVDGEPTLAGTAASGSAAGGSCGGLSIPSSALLAPRGGACLLVPSSLLPPLLAFLGFKGEVMSIESPTAATILLILRVAEATVPRFAGPEHGATGQQLDVTGEADVFATLCCLRLRWIQIQVLRRPCTRTPTTQLYLLTMSPFWVSANTDAHQCNKTHNVCDVDRFSSWIYSPTQCNVCK